MLICQLPPPAHNADGPGRGNARLEYGDTQSQSVSGAHRLLPLQYFEPR